MDLGDIATGKLYDGRISPIGSIRGDYDRGSGRLRLCESICQVRDLIAGHLSSVRIRKKAICHEHSQLAEARLDPNSPVGVIGAPDFDAGRMPLVGDNFGTCEGQEIAATNDGTPFVAILAL